MARRSYRSDVKHVIYLQSCLRRRLARKELKALKAEARSVSKFKEISYRLENKVVELTQSLQKRTEEKKGLEVQLRQIEQQLQSMTARHDDADARSKQLHGTLLETQAQLAERDDLLTKKADVEKRLEDALARAAEKEETIQKLTSDVVRQAAELEARQKALDAVPVRNADDSSVILTLKNEVSSLREQLNRANALNALTSKGARLEPVSPTFAPNLRLGDPVSASSAATNGVPTTNGRGHQRRHSSAGVYAITPSENRTSADELMMMAKRSQTANPRAVSVAYNADDGISRFRGNGLSDIYDDPAEEKIRLMQDARHLDEDVLDGLIRALKIPPLSPTNPSVVKEVLFPANLISLITNEMWKYGLIQESERFLANVMQTIQTHVMVRIEGFFASLLLIFLEVFYRRGCDSARHFLAIQCSRNALLYLCG
jgi:myosin V